MENEKKKEYGELNDEELIDVTGGADASFNIVSAEECVVPGCHRPATKGEYCESCYNKRWSRYK
ncbi:MAG: hypothetical protein IJS45_12065 [Clostridia bacterium]|nr:hypothetical protein [Clostridia bacterium]